jgi:FdhD protein
VDTIAGWMALNLDDAPAHPGSKGSQASAEADQPPVEKIFYTTGRLTSEMVIKSAQMGVAIVVSRSGITQMGLEVAQRVGLCAIGRATNKRFLCYANAQRLVLDAIPPEAPMASAGDSKAMSV